MLNKDYLIQFNEDGSRGVTYANNIHYQVIEPQEIIEINEEGTKTVTGYTDEEIINLVDGFDYQKCLDEGYEWISDKIYQKLLGNFDGQEYIKSDDTYIPKPPYEPSLDELKEIKLNKAGELFAQKRDAIRWVKVDGIHTYGFDCASEDITNFLAAYTFLDTQVEKSNTTMYKIWLDKENKGIVELNLEQMSKVFNDVRTSQFEAYAWYENIKQQINNCQSKEDLNAINII